MELEEKWSTRVINQFKIFTIKPTTVEEIINIYSAGFKIQLTDEEAELIYYSCDLTERESNWTLGWLEEGRSLARNRDLELISILSILESMWGRKSVGVVCQSRLTAILMEDYINYYVKVVPQWLLRPVNSTRRKKVFINDSYLYLETSKIWNLRGRMFNRLFLIGTEAMDQYTYDNAVCSLPRVNSKLTEIW